MTAASPCARAFARAFGSRCVRRVRGIGGRGQRRCAAGSCCGETPSSATAPCGTCPPVGRWLGSPHARPASKQQRPYGSARAFTGTTSTHPVTSSPGLGSPPSRAYRIGGSLQCEGELLERLEPGKEYRFKVRAVNANGPSEWSRPTRPLIVDYTVRCAFLPPALLGSSAAACRGGGGAAVST